MKVNFFWLLGILEGLPFGKGSSNDVYITVSFSYFTFPVGLYKRSLQQRQPS